MKPVLHKVIVTVFLLIWCFGIMQMYTLYVLHIENLMGNTSFLNRLIKHYGWHHSLHCDIILSQKEQLTRAEASISFFIWQWNQRHQLLLILMRSPVNYICSFPIFSTLFMHYLENQVIMSQEYRSIKIVLEISSAHPTCLMNLLCFVFICPSISSLHRPLITQYAPFFWPISIFTNIHFSHFPI